MLSSQSLAIFITPFGRYRYLHAPYRLPSIAEHCNPQMAEISMGFINLEE